MVGKIVSTAVLSMIGIGALSDFVAVHHARLDQFSFMVLSAGIVSLCAAIFCWRCWDEIREGYAYRQAPESEGVELPRFAWSERLGMGALFNMGSGNERERSKSRS